MTCVRREAGAHRPAAFAPSRSPSSGRTPPGDRSRPDPRGGRVRLSLVLPVVALLLGALGLFAAAPAQAQTTVWSATLTVDYATDTSTAATIYGCGGGVAWPSTTCGATDLSDTTFTWSGTDYTIDSIYLYDGRLNFELVGLTATATKAALTGLTLTVGTGSNTPAFAFANASVTSETRDVQTVSVLQWTPSPALSWSHGNMVALKLTAPASASKPVKPAGLSATAGDGEVSLAWTNPNDATITKYQVRRRTGNSWGSWADIPDSAPGEANATSYTVTSLSNGTAYRFRIRAVNAQGNGPQSDATTAVAPTAPAARPTGLTATAGNGRVKLAWTNPNDASIRKYQVQRKTGAAWESWADIPDSAPGQANAASYMVTSLSNGTAYSFRIRSVNAAGNSPQSDAAGPVTPSTTAMIPVSNSGTAVWSAGLAVSAKGMFAGCSVRLGSCAARLSDDDITHEGATYKVHAVFYTSSIRRFYLGFADRETALAARNALAGLTLRLGAGTNAPAFAISDGAVGRRDTWLSWYYPSGLSWSTGDTVVLKLTAAASIGKPARPTGLTATAGNAQVSLAWTSPNDAGITKYQVQRRTGAAWGSWADIPSSAAGEANAASYTVRSLSNGTAYSFRIRAVNAAGNSPQSDVAGPVRPSTPAMNPFGNGGTTVWSATLTVDKESEFYGCADADSTHDDCSAALTDNDFAYGGATYTVDTLYWQSSADRLLLGVANVGGAATRTALAGLTLNVNGDAFAVSDAEPLTNFIDWTYDPSPDWADGQRVSVSLTAAVSRPEMPTGLTATAGNAQVALAWTDPDDSSITKYQVQKRTGAAWGSWADIPDSAPGEANAASYTVTGLSNGTAYWFRIRAVNAVDNGPRSDTAGPARPFTTARTPARNTGGTIWSATLTVDRNGAFAGCDNSEAGRDDCSNALSDDDFGYDGVSYEVDRLYWAAEGGDVLYMAFKNVPGTVAKSRFYRLILNVNGRPFAVADSTGHVYQVYWDVPDPGWTDGQRIRVSLAAVPISGLRAEPGVTQVKLGWNNPSSCTVAAKCSYRIDYRKAGDRWASGPSFTSLTTATVPDLLQATEYEFRIFRRVGGATRAMGLVTAMTKTPAQPPGQPQGLAAKAGREWVELRWNDPGDPAIGGYQYRQKQDGSDWGAWTDIADSDNGTTYHKITDLAGDRAYRFQIRAVNVKGDGPASAEAGAEPWAQVHVKSIAVVSSPHRGDTYHAQEEIVVEVTFSSEVRMTVRLVSVPLWVWISMSAQRQTTPLS